MIPLVRPVNRKRLYSRKGKAVEMREKCTDNNILFPSCFFFSTQAESALAIPVGTC